MKNTIYVTTSWDDGHKLDLKLAELLAKYKVQGTFYISPKDREFPKSQLLTKNNTRSLDNHFEIGAHTMTHPSLTKIPLTSARNEIVDSKEFLENVLGKNITSFCYPKGLYNSNIYSCVKEAGFAYARSVRRFVFDVDDKLACGTTVHTYNHKSPNDLFNILSFSNYSASLALKRLDWSFLAKAMFDYTLYSGRVFHLWGHSWEIENQAAWGKFENVLEYISKRKNVKYVTNSYLSKLHSL